MPLTSSKVVQDKWSTSRRVDFELPSDIVSSRSRPIPPQSWSIDISRARGKIPLYSAAKLALLLRYVNLGIIGLRISYHSRRIQIWRAIYVPWGIRIIFRITWSFEGLTIADNRGKSRNWYVIWELWTLLPLQKRDCDDQPSCYRERTCFPRGSFLAAE